MAIQQHFMILDKDLSRGKYFTTLKFQLSFQMVDYSKDLFRISYLDNAIFQPSKTKLVYVINYHTITTLFVDIWFLQT